MNKRTLPTLVATGLAAVVATTTLTAGTASAAGTAPRAVGLTGDGTLVRFSVASPQTARESRPISGLVGDERLIGIDYRPANNTLYGVGNQGGVYTVAPGTAVATPAGRLTVPLEGGAFGVDFNPAADRLRIVSSTGQNLRHDVNPGGTTIVDTPLTTPPATEPTTGVTAAAYTNNDNDAATGTSLFDINTTNDTVAQQVPANSGTLMTQGPLGIDARALAGLDVHSADGVNKAFATLRTTGSAPRLYRVQLLSGDVTLVGRFPAGIGVRDVAVRPAV